MSLKNRINKGITLKNISYQYKKQDSGEEKYAIKDISLAIEPGEFVAIIGRTGSGKSTLIQHFNGLFSRKAGPISSMEKISGRRNMI